MKRPTIPLRILSIFLSLSLGLPNPAYALRQSGLEENSAKPELVNALVHPAPAAGAEEKGEGKKKKAGKAQPVDLGDLLEAIKKEKGKDGDSVRFFDGREGPFAQIPPGGVKFSWLDMIGERAVGGLRLFTGGKDGGDWFLRVASQAVGELDRVYIRLHRKEDPDTWKPVGTVAAEGAPGPVEYGGIVLQLIPGGRDVLIRPAGDEPVFLADNLLLKKAVPPTAAGAEELPFGRHLKNEQDVQRVLKIVRDIKGRSYPGAKKKGSREHGTKKTLIALKTIGYYVRFYELGVRDYFIFQLEDSAEPYVIWAQGTHVEEGEMPPLNSDDVNYSEMERIIPKKRFERIYAGSHTYLRFQALSHWLQDGTLSIASALALASAKDFEAAKEAYDSFIAGGLTPEASNRLASTSNPKAAKEAYDSFIAGGLSQVAAYVLASSSDPNHSFIRYQEAVALGKSGSAAYLYAILSNSAAPAAGAEEIPTVDMAEYEVLVPREKASQAIIYKHKSQDNVLKEFIIKGVQEEHLIRYVEEVNRLRQALDNPVVQIASVDLVRGTDGVLRVRMPFIRGQSLAALYGEYGSHEFSPKSSQEKEYARLFRAAHLLLDQIEPLADRHPDLVSSLENFQVPERFLRDGNLKPEEYGKISLVNIDPLNMLFLRVQVSGKEAPAAGAEEREQSFDGLTTWVDGRATVPADEKLLRVLKPGHRQIVLPSAGILEITRIFRMPGMQLQASVADAVGERNVVDIRKGSRGPAPFWQEWELKVGDVIILDIPAGQNAADWLPAELPRGVAVINLPGVQAAGLRLPQWASMVESALRRGGILPRVEEVIQAGAEQMVLDLGT